MSPEEKLTGIEAEARSRNVAPVVNCCDLTQLED